MMYYIHWDISPELTDILGLPIRYYGILFAAGIFLASAVIRKMYLRENKSEQLFNHMFMYAFIGIFVGARLGHCLFYDPGYYFAHPLEIILPFRIENGDFTYIGYQGLASHGGALGILIAIALFCYRYKVNYLGELDKIAVATPLAGAFIRLGNLMNSEIIGRPTHSSFGFIFSHVDNIPRHPTQLYEASAYLLIFLILWTIYKRYNRHTAHGFFFGLSIALIFIARFLIEFVKENQEHFEDDMLLNMGQVLSIPFILIGLALCIMKYRRESLSR